MNISPIEATQAHLARVPPKDWTPGADLDERLRITSRLVIALRRNGRQTAFLCHKSDAGVHMDVDWISDPDKPGATRDYLAQQDHQAGPLAPVGYGLVAIDFDQRQVLSVQGYKDGAVLTSDEVGSPQHAGPMWMDWKRTIELAFAREAVDAVVYCSRSGTGKAICMPLPPLAKPRAALALRVATTHKPPGFYFRGFRYRPSGWAVEHLPVTADSAGACGERAFRRLTRRGWACAPLQNWTSCSYC